MSESRFSEPDVGSKLTRSFYNRPTLDVARDLLGKYIIKQNHEARLIGRIVEVEAYIGQDDPACHAARGRTERNKVMFGPPGHAYIYLIYGMYHCLNFVTEPEGSAAAILLRAAEPVAGVHFMKENSPRLKPNCLLAGPGRFCRAFGLDLKQNGIDLTEDELYIADSLAGAPETDQSSRIGIRNGLEHQWRFFVQGSPSLSR